MTDTPTAMVASVRSDMSHWMKRPHTWLEVVSAGCYPSLAICANRQTSWRNAVNIRPHRICLWLFTLCLAITAHVHGQMSAPAAADPAWPRGAIADPTTVGFTKAGLDALDARLKQSVADGDTAGMTFLLIRHGQVADFKTFGQQTS